jgi:DNA polymerase-3 subunit delta'
MSNASNGSEPGGNAGSLSPLIGNPIAVAILSRALQSGRIGHAYLFHGPKGIGKSTAARRFAAAIQCEALRGLIGSPAHPGLQPCGVCDGCRRVAAGTHPDVVEVYPDTATGQNISVKQAGAVVANVALRPKLGPRRLFLIPNAELLHEDAANALLKTLEEPSPFATLVLCVPNVEQLLPTIRSRCQPVRFDPVPAALIAAALGERPGIAPGQAETLALSAGGRPGAALAAIVDEAFAARREGLLALFDAALDARARCAADPAEAVVALRLADELRAAAQDERGEAGGKGRAPAGERGAGEAARPVKNYLAEMLALGQTYLRDILVMGSGAPETALHHRDRSEQLSAHARRLDPAAALRLIDLLGETIQILDRNVPPQAALERMWVLFLQP